jgi:hypothetical protein
MAAARSIDWMELRRLEELVLFGIAESLSIV